jgi:hypothetical protein
VFVTRFRVWLSSTLNKLLPNVLAESARFYFWRFLRRLELPRCDANDPRTLGFESIETFSPMPPVLFVLAGWRLG